MAYSKKAEKKGISSREVLRRAYSELCSRNKPEEVAFSKGILTEIAREDDGYGSREGHMKYQKAGIFLFNGNHWAVSMGESLQDYLSEPFDSDLTAIEFPAEGFKSSKERMAHLEDKIRGSRYFRNSLIHSMSDGKLSVNCKSKLGMAMAAVMMPVMPRFIARQPKYDENALHPGTLKPSCDSPMLYKPDLSSFLAEHIEEILRSADGL